MSVCTDCPVCAPIPIFKHPKARQGDTKHCCPFFLQPLDEDGGGNLYRELPATCPHAAALKAVLADKSLVLDAIPETMYRAMMMDRGNTGFARGE